MKTTERFDNAVSKLYTAFHNGTLNVRSCQACAVGNICGSDDWKHILSPLNRPNNFRLSVFPNRKQSDFNEITMTESMVKSGYSAFELSKIEKVFIDNHNLLSSDDSECNIKNTSQYNGLCAVVEYLCELDNIPNVMDYTKLFESENNEPKYQLQN